MMIMLVITFINTDYLFDIVHLRLLLIYSVEFAAALNLLAKLPTYGEQGVEPNQYWKKV